MTRQSDHPNRTFQLEALEPRLLLSGEGAALLAEEAASWDAFGNQELFAAEEVHANTAGEANQTGGEESANGRGILAFDGAALEDLPNNASQTGQAVSERADALALFNAGQETLSLEIGEVLRIDATYTANENTGDGDPIATVDGAQVSFIGALSSWQTSAALDGIVLYDDRAEIDSATLSVTGAIGGDPTLLEFTNLAVALNDIVVTFDSDGGERSNFEVDDGTLTFAADAGALFPSAVDLLTVNLRAPPDTDDPAISGSVNLSDGSLAFNVENLEIIIGSALRIDANTVHFAISGDTPETGAVFATIGSATARTLELKDANGDPFEFQMDPDSGNKAVTIRSDGFTIHNGVLDPNTVAVDGVLSLQGLQAALQNVTYATGDSGGLSGSVQFSANGAALFPGNDLISASLSGISGGYDLAEGASGLSLQFEQLELEVGEALSLSANDVVATPGQDVLLTIGSAIVQSPRFDNVGAAIARGLEIRKAGFSIPDLTLQSHVGANARIGDFLELSAVQLTVSNFSVEIGDSTTVNGTISAAAQGVSIYPDGTFIQNEIDNLSLAYDFDNGGLLTIAVSGLSLQVGEAFLLDAGGDEIVITPGQSTFATLPTLTVSSPQFSGMGTVTIHNFQLRQNGFTLGNVTLNVASGAVPTIGDFLSIDGLSITASKFGVTLGDTTAVTGSVTLTANELTLYPQGGLISSTASDFTASYDFSNAGSLSFTINDFQLDVGEALRFQADTATVTPGKEVLAVIDGIQVSSPMFASLGSVSVNGFELRRQGFGLDGLDLPGGGGVAATLGDYLSFEGLRLAVEDFDLSYRDSIKVEGQVTLTADSVELYPGSSLVKSGLTGVAISYRFDAGGELILSVGDFELTVGEALQVTASNVTLTPGADMLVEIESAFASSPGWSGLGSVSLEQLAIRRDGFDLGDLTIAQPRGVEARIGDFISFSGARIVASDFGVTIGDQTTVSGTIGLQADAVELYPDGTFLSSNLSGLNGTYDFSADGGGALTITIDDFSLAVGEALEVAAQGVEIAPGADTIATIDSATVRSPQFDNVGTANLDGFELRRDGFAIGSLELDVANGGSATVGGFLSATGLSVTAADFEVSYGTDPSVSGTVTLSADALSLYPQGGLIASNATDFTASYDFSDAGSLLFSINNFQLNVGEALSFTANEATVTPGKELLATIDSITVSSPMFASLGTVSLSGFELRRDGFRFDSLDLPGGGGVSAALGSYLSFENLKLTAQDFDLAYGEETSVEGQVSLTADSVQLYPGGSLISSSLASVAMSFDFNGGGKLKLSVGEFDLSIGEALQLTANNVVITPGEETLAAIDSAFVNSPGWSGLGSLNLEGLSIRRDGFDLGDLTIAQPEGLEARIGDFIAFSGVRIIANDFSVTTGDQTTVSGTIGLQADSVKLYPDGTFITSDLNGFNGTFEFGNGGDGALTITVDDFNLAIGEALTIHASGVEISPGSDTIATLDSATVSSPQFDNLGTASLTDFDLNGDGFTVGSLELNVANGGSATVGSFLSVSGLMVAATDFAVDYSDSVDVSGALTVSADSLSLFPDVTIFQSDMTGVTGSYDFSGGTGSLELTIATFNLAAGEAVRMSAGQVKLTPGRDTIATISELSVDSPMITNFEPGTLTNVVIRKDGFDLGSLVVRQAENQTAQIGSFLSFSGAVLSLNEFSFTQGGSPAFSGTVQLTADEVNLFPGNGLVTSQLQQISGAYSFGDSGNGALTLRIGNLDLYVGQALHLNASNVSITPGEEILTTIENATVTSPTLSGFGSATISDLDIRRDGFDLGSLTITQAAGKTAAFGDFLNVTGGAIAANDFSVTIGDETQVSGEIKLSADSLALFPNASFLTTEFENIDGTYEFDETDGTLKLSIGTFRMAIGEALQISANGVTITPDSDTLIQIDSADLSSPAISGLKTASIDGLTVTRSGFQLDDFSIEQQDGVQASFGSFLNVSGVRLSGSNINVQTGDSPSFSGAISLSIQDAQLFPQATFLASEFSGITAAYDFETSDGELTIAIGTFDLSIGSNAVHLSGEGVEITPGRLTLATVESLTVTAQGFENFESGSIDNLAIRQDGFSLGALTLNQSADQPVSFGGFLEFSGAALSINNFTLINDEDGVSVQGGIQFSADRLSLFPGSAFISTVIEGFDGSYDFGADGSGRLKISVGLLKLNVGSDALAIQGSNIELDPSADTITTIEKATISSPKFANLPTGTLEDLEITQTGFSLGALTLSQKEGTNIAIGDLLSFEGLSVSLQDFSYEFGGDESVNGTIAVAADSSSVFPGSGLFTATVTGFNGSFGFGGNKNGALSLKADQLLFEFGTTLTIEADGIDFNPDADVIASADSVTASLPSLSVEGSATGFEVTGGGQFSVVTLTLNTEGIASTLGLGEFLPFDITDLEVAFLGDANGNGQRDEGEVFNLTEFDLTVSGNFNFSSMESLPFTPIIRIGDDADQTSFDDPSDTFSFTIRVEDGKILPENLGPIEIGFADLVVGQNVILGGSIILGGYQSAHWVSEFGGSISMQQTGEMNGLTGGSATIVGTYDDSTSTITAVGEMTVSFNFGSSIQVTNAGLKFHFILSQGGGFDFSVDELQLESASVEQIQIQFGSLLTMTGTNVAIDLNPSADDNIASFGSLSATIPDLGFTGTARQFAIGADGKIKALDGFGVDLNIQDSSKVSWPSWLPIQITEIGLTWPEPDVDLTNFQITLSASVTEINGLPLTVSGEVEGVVIDIELLKAGKFPIIDIGSAGVSVGGEMFGGEAEGALVLGVIKLDADGNRVESGDEDTGVAERIFYGGIEAGFNFAGMSGFSIRIGLSELGPLQLYMSASVPVLLDPDTGLSITDFRAGVTFGDPLPSITDPMELRGSEFKPQDDLSFNEWVALLEQEVVNQAQAGGEDQWGNFDEVIRIEGGATLFSIYTSEESFKADIDIILSTDGKFLIDASMTFGETLSLEGMLYADLSQVSSGSASILFLVDEPAADPDNPLIEPIVTYFGGIEFEFVRNDGAPVTASNPADTFRIRISGGVELQALSFASVTIEGEILMGFSENRFDLQVTGSVNLQYLGDAIGLAGTFHMDNTGDETKVWGAFALTPNFGKLEQVGLFVDASALLRLNMTGDDTQETLSIPGRGDVTVDLPANSFSVLIEGYLIFKQAGTEWFHMQGTFGMEIDETALSVFAQGDLILGPLQAPLLTFNFNGFMQINEQGIAALFDLNIATNFPKALGIELDASFSLLLNTTENDVNYALPDSIIDIPSGASGRTVQISARPSDDAGVEAQPYLKIDATGALEVLAFELQGDFHLLIDPDVFEVSADATLDIAAGGTTLFSFNVEGGLRIDSTGLAAAMEVDLGGDLPDSLGFSFGGELTFGLYLNTTGKAVTFDNGLSVRADRYAEVRIHGALTISGLVFEGDFDLTVDESLIRMEADASLALSVAGTTILSFEVAGGFQISDEGIAAAFELTLTEDIPDDLGFTLEVDYLLEVNTTSAALTLAGIPLEAGPFGRVSAQGVLKVEGFEIEGEFDITVGTTFVRIDASAALDIEVGGFELFSFTVTGGLLVSEKGLAAVLDLELSSGVPSSFGFSVEASFELAVNTTNEAQSFKKLNADDDDESDGDTIDLEAGVYARVSATGQLIVIGLTIEGTLDLTLSEEYVQMDAAGSLDLEVAGTTLFHFDVDGDFRIDSSGIAASFDLTLDAGLPDGFGIDFDASFMLEVNTTGAAVNFQRSNGDAVSLEAGTFARVAAEGSLSVFGFKFGGSFSITAGTDQFVIRANVSFKLFTTSLSVDAEFGLYSDGMAAKFLLDLNLLDEDFFTVQGSFGLEINTTDFERLGVAPNTGRVFAEDVIVSIGIDGFSIKLTGSISIGVVDGVFAIEVPSDDPLTLDFFGIVEVEVFGFIHGDGQFSIHGIVDLTFGREDLAAITGDLAVTVSNDGFSASLNGSVVVFEQRVLQVSGSISLTSSGFRLVAEASVNLPSPLDLISINAHFDISVSSDGIEISITASVNLWSFLSGSVTGYVDTGDGSWFFQGSAGFHVGGSFLGAEGHLSLNVGYLATGKTFNNVHYDAGWHTRLDVGGSAWAGFSIAGHRIGVSVGLDGTLDLNEAEVSVTAHGSIDLVVTTIHWSKTITIQFRNGVHIYLSDVGGSIVFLDVNKDNILNPGEPWTVADENGFFSFDHPIHPVDAGTPDDTPFQSLDANNSNLIEANEGRFLLFDGKNRSTGEANRDIVDLGIGQIAGITNFSGATVFIDVNSNRQLDEGEHSTTTSDADGSYSILDVLFPSPAVTPEDLLGSLVSYDSNGNGVIDPEEGQFILMDGTNLDSGEANSDTIVLTNSVPAGFTRYSRATVALDLNSNGVLDDGEPTTVTSADGRYSFLKAVEEDLSQRLGMLSAYDLNMNGVLDDDEGQLYVAGGLDPNQAISQDPLTFAAVEGVTQIDNARLSGHAPYIQVDAVFFDANGNQTLDADEVSVQPNGDGFYSFLNNPSVRGDLGALGEFDVNGNGVIDAEEGVLRVIGGEDANNGLPNLQAVNANPDGYGSGVRHLANPLAHIHVELEGLDLSGEEIDRKIEAAFGLPMFTDVKTFDPSQEEEMGTGKHHEVEGASSQISHLLLNGASLLQGAAKGNLSESDAQDAIYQALASRVAEIVPDDLPASDDDGDIIGADPKLDLSDDETVSAILQDAAQSLGLTLESDASIQQASLNAAAASEPPDIRSEVLQIAAQIIANHGSLVNQLVDERMIRITEALSRSKHVTQTMSAPMIHALAAGELSIEELSGAFTPEIIKTQMKTLTIPSGEHAPIIRRLENLNVDPGETVIMPFILEDPDGLSDDLDVRIHSDNGDILPADAVQILGEGKRRELVFTTQAGVSGQAVLTLFASDGRSSAEIDFTVNTALRIESWQSVANHGSAGARRLEIPDDDSFSEPRSTGVSRIAVQFSHPIVGSTFSARNLVVERIDAATQQPVRVRDVLVITTVNAEGTEATIHFAGGLPDRARYQITVTNVQARNGTALAGDNDRILTALTGDANGDLRVNNLDAAGALSLAGETLDADSPAMAVRSDIDANGVVDEEDTALILSARGAEVRFTTASFATTAIDRFSFGPWHYDLEENDEEDWLRKPSRTIYTIKSIGWFKLR